jgi:hypothetical protein
VGTDQRGGLTGREGGGGKGGRREEGGRRGEGAVEERLPWEHITGGSWPTWGFDGVGKGGEGRGGIIGLRASRGGVFASSASL